MINPLPDARFEVRRIGIEDSQVFGDWDAAVAYAMKSAHFLGFRVYHHTAQGWRLIAQP